MAALLEYTSHLFMIGTVYCGEYAVNYEKEDEQIESCHARTLTGGIGDNHKVKYLLDWCDTTIGKIQDMQFTYLASTYCKRER